MTFHVIWIAIGLGSLLILTILKMVARHERKKADRILLQFLGSHGFVPAIRSSLRMHLTDAVAYQNRSPWRIHHRPDGIYIAWNSLIYPNPTGGIQIVIATASPRIQATWHAGRGYRTGGPGNSLDQVRTVKGVDMYWKRHGGWKEAPPFLSILQVHAESLVPGHIRFGSGWVICGGQGWISIGREFDPDPRADLLGLLPIASRLKDLNNRWVLES